MAWTDFFVDYPWVVVIGAALLGVLCGVLLSFARWANRSDSSESGELWTCDEVILRCCRRCCAGAGCRRCRSCGPSSGSGVWSKAVVVAGLAVCTMALDIVAFVFATGLQERLNDMTANMVGDEEKRIVDECMRDFEGMQLDDMKYIQKRSDCIAQLEMTDRVQLLPNIRLTVDERVCDPAYLCEGAVDERTCMDSGEPLTDSFSPGWVTYCYDLISKSKAARVHTEKAQMLDKIEATCVGKDSWKGYERQVQLDYCMWKHNSAGLCTNSMRTNCPTDTSCCPIAQNSIAGAGAERLVRPNRFVCQKSPTVGLYCQRVDYTDASAQGDFDANTTRPLCTDVTCPSFGWCRDFADIPNLCLTEACEMYRRSLGMAAAVIACLAVAVALDIIDVLLLLRCPRKRKAKAILNMMGVAVRMLTYLFCVAGGIRDFTRTAMQHACFSPAGNERVKEADMSVNAAGISVLIGMACMIWIWYLTAKWGTVLIGLPHTKWHDGYA